ncbi:MAG: hypothetical protein J3Q66DRAFT_406479 [Benniella sp.]|nr:MAG: hypothetical protein J3Q66DRAFT_406479 [Benniella sp.]
MAAATLAVSIATFGMYYVYRRRRERDGRRPGDRSPRTGGAQNDTSQENNARTSLETTTRSTTGVMETTEAQASSSSLSRIGSRIAQTVKRNRKVLTISVKNTIVWNPSPDPTAPNYGFVEGIVPLLTYLAQNFNLHLILLCPSHQQQNQAYINGKDRVLSIREQDEQRRQQQLAQDSDKEQILTMLRNAGLVAPPGTRGPKLIDPRKLLVCETEEGVSHVVRHLESQIHVDAMQNVVEMVQGVIPRVVYVQKRAGHSRASSNASQVEDVMTRSHFRVRSTSRSSSAGSGSFGEDHGHGHGHGGYGGASFNGSPSSSHMMGESFVEVMKTGAPLTSGFVIQAGKRGYLEVTDQMARSSVNPEFKE